MLSLDVLLFASYADAAGAGRLRVTVADGACVRDVVLAVRTAAPALSLPSRPLVAVNHRYAKGDDPIGAADEIALIPPVAGG